MSARRSGDVPGEVKTSPKSVCPPRAAGMKPPWFWQGFELVRPLRSGMHMVAMAQES